MFSLFTVDYKCFKRVKNKSKIQFCVKKIKCIKLYKKKMSHRNFKMKCSVTAEYKV